MIKDKKFNKGLKKLNREELVILWASCIIAAVVGNGDELIVQRAAEIRARLDAIGEQEFFYNFVTEQAEEGLIPTDVWLYECILHQFHKDEKRVEDVIRLIERGEIKRYIFIETLPYAPEALVDKVTTEDIQNTINALYNSAVNYVLD